MTQGATGGGAYGVQSNGQGTADLGGRSLAGVVNHGLVVLKQLLATVSEILFLRCTNLIRAVGEVHADNVQASCELSANHGGRGVTLNAPLRSMLIFSAELVLGPGMRKSAWRISRRGPGAKGTYQWCR